jgi:hypothetical protein
VLRHPSDLEYTFTLAWSIHGGIKLPEGTKRLDLINSKHGQIYLCTEISDDLRQVMSMHALRSALVFKRFSGNQLILVDAHKQAFDSLVNEVEAKSRSRVMLCYRSNGIFPGEIDFDRCYCDEDDDACLCHDAFNDSALVEQAQGEILMAKLALSRLHDGDIEYQHLFDFLDYRDDSGRPYFRIKVQGNAAKMYIGKTVDDALSQSASKFLRNAGGLSTSASMPLTLFSIVTQVDTDPLLAFVAGWAALDLLIEDAYEVIRWNEGASERKKKDRACLESLGLGNLGNPGIFLRKFAAVTSILFRETDKNQLCASILECHSEYESRNRLYHDGANISSPPSIHFLSKVLAKYLYAFLDSGQLRHYE